jgi:heptosyltransferase-2
MKVAIVKPDHLGDLILSSGTIRAVARSFPESVLFVARKNLGLASYLFPEMELAEINFPHLNKGMAVEGDLTDLTIFDQVLMFRNDRVVTQQWLKARCRWYAQSGDSHDVHQTVLDYGLARTVMLPFDLDDSHFGDGAKMLQRKARSKPKKIGISIGSGFHANGWPILYWVKLVRRLLEDVESVTILAGPAERTQAQAIALAVGKPATLSISLGTGDFRAFNAIVSELDLVIASDGGTAHLCSLGAPILSVFGPSPFRRYAPFGAHNRLLTRNLACSPCCQYAAHLANGCLANECMLGIDPEIVAAAVLTPPASWRPEMTEIADGILHVVGASHLRREEMLETIDG